jgi:YD repeat-containing protein
MKYDNLTVLAMAKQNLLAAMIFFGTNAVLWIVRYVYRNNPQVAIDAGVLTLPLMGAGFFALINGWRLLVGARLSQGPRRESQPTGSKRPWRFPMFRKAVLTLAVAMIPVVALAQHPQSKSGTTRFYNQQGRPQGHSTSQGGTTRFYNQQGRPQGRIVRPR